MVDSNFFNNLREYSISENLEKLASIKDYNS